MKLSIKTGAALVGVFAVVATPAQADIVRYLQVSDLALAKVLAPKGTAAASFGSPLAYGASWGNVGVGFFGQTLGNTEDGGLGFLMGLGDAKKAVGLEASMTLSSLLDDQGGDGGFGDNGSFSLKAHTALPGGAAFAVGVSNFGRFGDANDASKSSVFAVASKAIPLSMGGSTKTLVLNLGVGDNGFVDPGEEGAGPFGSAAFYFTPQISAIVDYTGRFTNIGVSVAPFKQLPLSVTLGAINVGSSNGADTEFGGSIGYGFKF
jgi:hypothetical protein